MATIWFILDGEQHRGPLTADELVKELIKGRRPHNVPIWREGLPGWQAASLVPEIREMLPPLPPSATSDQRINDVPSGAEDIAKYYRLLVLLVGLQIVLGFFQFPGMTSATPSTLSLIVSLALLGILAAMAFTAYHLTRLLDERLPILWGMAMFLPCINIIGLLLISSKAQVWCKRYGIAVGLFGPTKESIDELRYRIRSPSNEA
jgi:hypothetical protein